MLFENQQPGISWQSLSVKNSCHQKNPNVSWHLEAVSIWLLNGWVAETNDLCVWFDICQGDDWHSLNYVFIWVIHLCTNKTDVVLQLWIRGMVKEMATHSSILIWEIHGQRSLVASLWGCKELETTWQEWMKRKNGDFPGESSRDSTLPKQGVQVWSLVGELRSHMLNQEFTCHN